MGTIKKRGLSTIVVAAAMTTLIGCSDLIDVRGMAHGYQTANERFEQSMAYNELNGYKTITVSTDTYTILAMGDSHLGGAQNLDTLIAHATKKSAAATLMAGDLTSGQVKDFQEFKRHIPAFDSVATFLVAGNHDLYFNGWEEYQRLFGTSTFYFEVITPTAKDLYFGLDNSGGTLGSQQIEWLKKVLEEKRSNYRNCVFFTHVNLFRERRTASTNPMVEELRLLNELCAQYSIDMAITGHDHEQNILQFGNTVHVTMDALQDIQKRASYFEVTVQPDTLIYEFVYL